MADKEKHSVDLRDIAGIAWKRKWLLIVPVVIATIAGFGSTYVLTPKYRASTIVWIDKPHNVSRELMSIIGTEVRQYQNNADRNRELQALKNELTSQTYLFKLIRDLGLDDDPEVARQAAKMRESSPNLSLEELKLHLIRDQIKEGIGVGSVGTDQIQITAESTSPKLARDMAARLAEIMEEEKSKYELEKILDNQAFADMQLQRTEHDYRQTLDSLTALQSRLSRLQLPENISSQENRREILADIDRTKLEISDREEELQAVGRELAALNLTGVRLRFADTLVELRAEIDGLVRTFSDMMEKYAWNAQNVVNISIRLNDNMRMLDRELGRAVDGQFPSLPENQRALLRQHYVASENLDILRSKLSRLQESMAAMDQRINYLPRLQAEISELERQLTETRRYRDAFRSEETTVEILSDRAKERTKYQIIEPAQIPLAPYWPDKKKVTVMGLLLGMVIGGAAVFLSELLDASFKTVEQTETVLQLPVLATIPRIEKLKITR